MRRRCIQWLCVFFLLLSACSKQDPIEHMEATYPQLTTTLQENRISVFISPDDDSISYRYFPDNQFWEFVMDKKNHLAYIHYKDDEDCMIYILSSDPNVYNPDEVYFSDEEARKVDRAEMEKTLKKITDQTEELFKYSEYLWMKRKDFKDYYNYDPNSWDPPEEELYAEIYVYYS